MKIKCVLVNDPNAPGGQAIWDAEKGWHTLPKGVKVVWVLPVK